MIPPQVNGATLLFDRMLLRYFSRVSNDSAPS